MRQITSEKNARNGGRKAAAAAGELRRHREMTIRAQWEPGLTVSRLSKRTGLTPNTVRTFCRRLGLDLAAEPRGKVVESPYRDNRVSDLAKTLARSPWTAEGMGL